MTGRKRLRRIAALLGALLCGLILPARADLQFDAAALLEDFDYLRTALEADYPFLPVLAGRGVDFEALCGRARRWTARCGGSLDRFYDGIAGMLAGMDNFAHLEAVSPALFRFCDAHQDLEPAPLRDMLADEQTRRTYAALGARREAEAAPPKIETAWYPEERALVFRVASFDQESIERDRFAVAEGVAAHPDARHIAFDITGNRGGSDLYWSAVIVAPFGGKYACRTTDFTRDTPLCRAYLGAENLRAVEAYPGELPGFVSELGLTHYVEAAAEIPLEPYGGPVVGVGAKRWVLIDGAVFSAADGFARFCGDTGWATLVGSPAMGGGAKGCAPFVVRLPNTGLLVRFDAVAAANADGSLNALAGTRPDIPCKPRETPLAAFLRAVGE